MKSIKSRTPAYGEHKATEQRLQTSPNTWGGFKHVVILILRTPANS